MLADYSQNKMVKIVNCSLVELETESFEAAALTQKKKKTCSCSPGCAFMFSHLNHVLSLLMDDYQYYIFSHLFATKSEQKHKIIL